MSYSLSNEKKDDILWVTATGTRNLETILAMSKDIQVACVENKVKKVLIDVRGLEGRLNMTNQYRLVANEFPKMRNRSVITHNAIVDLKEFKDSYKFLELVAHNRGYLLRIFSDPEQAITWLK